MTELTISAQPTFVEYQIASLAPAQTLVAPFEFFSLEDIKVHVVADEGTFDLEHNSGGTANGTVVDGGYSAGTFTFDSGYTNATIKIYRSVVVDRTANYPIAGPISMETLNNELNKITAILQELDEQKDNFIFLPESSLSTDPWDLSGRVAGTAGEGTADDDLATNRQVDASGPNWLEDNDTESAIGSNGQWNTVFSQSNIIIQGSADKVMDLMTQFFGFIQNRDTNEATFQVRYRYQVDCYSQVSKETNANYLYKVPGTSMIAFNFMDIARGIDYSNGNCTLMVAIDIKPIGVDSDLLYIQWGNLAVNTSEPRTLGP